MTTHKRTLGFIGAGKMGGALAVGVASSNVCAKEDIVIADTCEVNAKEMKQRGFKVTDNAADVLDRAQVVFLAVKPQQLDAVAELWQPSNKEHTLIISVIAGASLHFLKRKFPGSRVVRAMPNTPCLIGKGASAFCTDPDVPAEDKAFVQRVFGSVGIVYEVDESQMDAVTAVTAPAYGYMVIEAMTEGGVRSGLPYDIAVKLAAQTLVGAGEMVLSTNEHPAVLKSHVCSPGGTTIAAVAELEDGGIRATLMTAVGAAAQRSHDMGQLKSTLLDTPPAAQESLSNMHDGKFL